MSVERPPVAGQTEYKHWAERLNSFLTRTKSHLAFYVSGATAYRDGMLVWDDNNKTILYSGNGQWNTIGNGVAGADGTDGTDGTGFTGGSYDSNTGVITFTSNDGLGFSTTDVRGSNGTDGDGFTGGSYNASTGIVTFTSDDGLGFSTTDIRGTNGTDGDGFTGGSYNASTGVVTFTSDDGLGFSTGDLRGADVDYTQVSALYHNGNIVAEATADGVTVTGDVEATEFIGDLRGAVVFKAQAGEALTKGDVVYISGISGNTTVVSKADADDAAKMPAFGLAAKDANNNANLEVYTFGTLSGLDTSSYTEGDELFVSTTAGALVSTAPAGEGSLVQKIGKVTRSHASAGSIKIMGAGRTNATPNLNDGNIFIGDSNNQSVTASLATQVSALETSHNDVLVDGDFTSNGFMKTDGAGTYSIDTSTYLTSFTEANDLSTTVTWADVPDANITETSVTQHQTALSITESQISDLQTYLTTHQDISGKANLSGATFTGDVSIGTLPSNPESLSVTGSTSLYGGASVTGDITVTGTVDGVDVGNLKYHKEDYLMIRDGGQKPLTTSFACVGNYCYIHDMLTPMATMRFLDVNLKISWGYTSSTNDLQVKFSLYVPTGVSSNGESLGSATQISGGEYSTVSVYEQWYSVAGNKTHLFTEFGAVHENQTGGSFEKKIYSWQYEPSQNRTYFLLTTYPSAPASGTTLYWHPYAWESAGTALIEYRDIDERYFSGTQNAALMFKTAYDSRQLKYSMEIRELGSGDSGQIMQSFVKISKQEP